MDVPKPVLACCVETEREREQTATLTDGQLFVEPKSSPSQSGSGKAVGTSRAADATEEAPVAAHVQATESRSDSDTLASRSGETKVMANLLKEKLLREKILNMRRQSKQAS
jgi:hypothetical protein